MESVQRLRKITECMSWYLAQSTICPCLGKDRFRHPAVFMLLCSIIKHKSYDSLNQIIAANLGMLPLKGNPVRNTFLTEKETKETWA